MKPKFKTDELVLIDDSYFLSTYFLNRGYLQSFITTDLYRGIWKIIHPTFPNPPYNFQIGYVVEPFLNSLKEHKNKKLSIMYEVPERFLKKF